MTTAVVPSVASASAGPGRRIAAGALGAVAALLVVRFVARLDSMPTWIRGIKPPTWLDAQVQRRAQAAYEWITDNTGRNALLDAVKSAGRFLGSCVRQVDHGLQLLHWTGVLTLVFVVCLLRAGWRRAVVVTAIASLVGFVGGFWDLTMVTVSIMLVAVVLSLLIGIPLGIWCARSPRVERIVRPVLDTAQVMPAYVYLIPIVLLFGIEFGSAVIATMIYATPPAVRLTSLGLREVSTAATESGRSFGATAGQLLRKVELPMARPAIALGLNQVIMMAFGIVVIASQLGTGDVGGQVLAGLRKGKDGAPLAFSAGLGIVFAAIALDRTAAAHGRAAPLTESAIKRRRWEWVAGGAAVVAAAVAAKIGGFASFPDVQVYVGDWLASATNWVVQNADKGVPVVGGTESFTTFLVKSVLNPVRDALQQTPWWLTTLAAGAIGWRAKGPRLGLLCGGLFVGIAAMRNWDLAMDTLSQVLVGVVLAMLIALPLGVWYGRSKRAEQVLRPLAETAQVLPQFVYLVPMVLLFNPGRTPGVVATIVYAIPPGIRLVGLGLQEVAHAPREAATSFGASPRQELFKVQLPLAARSIMLGVNQVILMALATVIIAALVGAGALGLEAYTAFTKPALKAGDGSAAGVSIVLLAIFLDRVTQSAGDRLGYARTDK